MITPRERQRFGMLLEAAKQGNLHLVETRDEKGIRRAVLVKYIKVENSAKVIAQPIAKMLTYPEVNALLDQSNPRKLAGTVES